MGLSSRTAFGAGGMLAVVVAAGFVGMVVLAAAAVVPVVSVLAFAS
jgi:hypothetical protein